MAEEQVTKKSSINYIEKIDKLPLSKKEARAIQERIVDKLNVLTYSMNIIREKIEDEMLEIENHWKDFGDNYNSIPILYSTIPSFTKSFGNFIALSYEENKIIVEELMEALKLADKQKENE